MLWRSGRPTSANMKALVRGISGSMFTPRAAGLLTGALVLLLGLHRASPHWMEGRYFLPGTDAEAYIRIARGLVSRGSLVLPPPSEIDERGRDQAGSVHTTPYAVTRDGRLFPKHPWAFGALLVPGVALGGATGAVLTGLLLGSVLAGLCTWLAAGTAGPLSSTAATLLLLVALPAGREACWGISLDVAMALSMLLAISWAEKGRCLRAGFLSGLSLFLRPTMPLLILPVPLLAARKGQGRGLTRLFAGFLPPALVWAWTNTAWWGAPWRSSYNRIAVFGPEGMKIESIVSAFRSNVLGGVYDAFLGSSEALLFAAPLVFVAALGFLDRSARRADWAGAYLASALAYTVLATYPSRSLRFAVPLLAASAPPLAVVLATLGRFRRAAPTTRPIPPAPREPQSS